MTQYRYEPEWQQPADRHTPLIDPVISVRQLARSDLASPLWFAGRRQPLGRVDNALVLVTDRGEYETHLPPHHPHRVRTTGPRYTAVYEVDLGSHPMPMALKLPSHGDAFEFSAAVDVTWQVADPARVVWSGVRDVPAMVTPRVERRMRLISRRFTVEDCADAEEAVQKELDREPIAAVEGIRVVCIVRLALDEAARAHQQRLRAIRHAMEVSGPEHEYQMLRARQEQELFAEKAAFYRHHLERGGVAQWALQLAAHPDDLPRALEMLREDERETVRKELQLFDKLLEHGEIEKYQLEETTRHATLAVLQILRQHFSTPPTTPPDALPPGFGTEPPQE